MDDDKPDDAMARLYMRLAPSTAARARPERHFQGPRSIIEQRFAGEHVDAMLERLRKENQKDRTLALYKRSQFFTHKGESQTQESRVCTRATLLSRIINSDGSIVEIKL